MNMIKENAEEIIRTTESIKRRIGEKFDKLTQHQLDYVIACAKIISAKS